MENNPIKKVLLLLLLAFCVTVSAQNEFLNKSNSITPLNKPNTGMTSGSTTTNSVYTPNVFNTNKKSTTSSIIPDKPVDMKQPEFANSGTNYEKHLNDKLKK